MKLQGKYNYNYLIIFGLSILFCSIPFLNCFAQTINIDKVYSENISSVQSSLENFELSTNIISLNSPVSLAISFDDLEADVKNYYATAIFCNANWEEADISSFDYLDGFSELSISDYQYSFNTLQDYTHYHFNFPHEDMKPTIPGNYLIKVYENNVDNPIFTKRVMVVADQAAINGRVRRGVGLGDRASNQSLEFVVATRDFNSGDDIKAVIIQNGRWDKQIELEPNFFRPEEIYFQTKSGESFESGKEFRNFDLRDLNVRTERVALIEEKRLGTDVYLFADEFRAFENAGLVEDINGSYVIETQGSRAPETEADYCRTYFSLMAESPFTNGKVYVFGELSNWELKEEFQMEYDFSLKGYRTSAILKQGYYNYQYVFLEDSLNTIDATIIDGNDHDTENDYYIFIYHRPIGTYYDTLVGYRRLNSTEF